MNFLILLGTQKCGTTWLGSQLRFHPQFFGPMKEWRSLSKIEARFLKNKKKFEKEELPVNLDILSKDKFMSLCLQEKRRFTSASLSNYMSLAVSCFQWKSDKNSEIKAVGDITGANGTLDENFLSLYRRVSEGVGLNLKPIYLMRDPVSRHFSAVKMKFWNTILNNKEVIREEFDESIHSEKLNNFCLQALDLPKYYNKRASYNIIIPKIERVFNSKEILYSFSEDNRDAGAIDRVTDFLEINRLDVDADSNIALKANIGNLEYEFPDSVKAKVYSHYSHVYFFVRDKFGDKVPRSWLSLGD